MTLVGYNISDLYKDMCINLIAHGKSIKRRGLRTKELFDFHGQLYHPRERFVNFKARNMSMRYCMGELCHYLDGRTDLKSIAHYGKFWEQVSDDGLTINSCYGARIFGTRHTTVSGPWPDRSWSDQFHYAVGCLEEDKNSNKAIMLVYDRSDARKSKDNPCTLTLQFIIRNDKLHMIANMRSQDVWLGVPYDFAFFTIVQEIARVELFRLYPNLRLGTYYHNVTSLHAYEDNYAAIGTLCHEGDHKLIMAPPIHSIDVDSWFNDLITFEKSKRGAVLYKDESKKTPFQDWCKNYL